MPSSCSHPKKIFTQDSSSYLNKISQNFLEHMDFIFLLSNIVWKIGLNTLAKAFLFLTY